MITSSFRNPPTSLAGVLVVLLLTVTACGDEPEDQQPAPEATYATYNVGLARGFVDYATARMNPVAEAVADIEADAVCLQEAWLVQDDNDEWTTEQIDAIVQAAAETYPHSYFEITEPEENGGMNGDGDGNGEDSACTRQETQPLENCIRSECEGVADDQLASCGLDKCGEQFNAVSSTCQTCIASNLGQSIDRIIASCLQGSAAMTSNGHNGLLLLSKHPFTSTEHRKLDSTVAQRSILHGVIDHPEMGTTDLYCTHLAADLSDSLPYPGEQYDSYEAEQAAQIDALLSWTDETAESDQIVIMGDMNTGPAYEDRVEAELPENYAKFREAGLQNPFINAGEPECTFCGVNTLVDSDANKVIDHVLLDFGGLAIAETTERILDERQTIETEDGDKELHLSDHFGVRSTITIPNVQPE